MGGGASSLPVPWRKHVASTVQARGAALVPLQVGGGLAVWLPSSPYLPPGGPPVGACTARAPFGHGRVVRPAPSLRCLPTLPRCPRGGGGPRSATVIHHIYMYIYICIYIYIYINIYIILLYIHNV